MTKKRHNNRNAQQDRSGHGKVKHLGNDKSKNGGRVIKEKYAELREEALPPITAKNSKTKGIFKTPQRV